MASVTLYLGEPGSGKSTLMRAHVEQLRRDPEAPIFLVVDHDDGWHLEGAGIYSSVGEWLERPQLVSIFRGAGPKEVAQLAIDVGWSVYVDDEVDLILGEGWKTSPLREIVKRGRHIRNAAGEITEVHALIATHRPSNLPTDVVGCMERVYLGKLHSFADAERVKREGWIDGRTVEEVADVLRRKAPGEFTIWPTT